MFRLKSIDIQHLKVITFLITNGHNKRELMIECEYMDTTTAFP